MGLIIFPFASMAGYCLFLSRFTTWPGAFIPFFTVSSFMVVLYGAAIAGLLRPGVYALVAIGIVCGFAGAYQSKGKLRHYFIRFLAPGPAVFFLLSLLLWFGYSGVRYSAWDEFSHWGLTIKEIFATNALLTADSVIACKDYPPATALFQYFMTVFTGWSEGVTCFAQTVLTLAAAITLITGVPWRQWLRIILILALSYAILAVFSFNLKGVYVDHLLGFFWGAILASYFLSEDRRPAFVLALLPALFVLPLIKSAGTLLALLAAAIIAADQLRNIKVARDSARSAILTTLGLCLILLLAPLVSVKTWSWRVSSLNLPQTLSTKAGYAEIKRPFSSAATERDETTLANFGEALFNTRTSTTLPPVFMILVMAIAAFALYHRARPPAERASILTASLLMLGGFLAYAAGLLFLYLFSFGAYEGPRLASFDRYMNIFFMSWTIIILIFVLRGRDSSLFDRLPFWAKTVAILSVLLFITKISIPKTPKEIIDLRSAAGEKAARAVSLIEPGARIYIIWQNDNGFGPQLLSYELAPHPTSIRSGPWSIGKPYSPDDVWTSDIPKPVWEKMLTEYDYVLVGNADQIFWDRFGDIFEVQAGKDTEYLFKVQVIKGKLRLKAASGTS